MCVKHQLAVIAFLLTLPSLAMSQNRVCGGTFEPIGDSGVSVHFEHVVNSNNPRAYWTWCFRNDNARRLEYMTYAYTDADGEHSDILPGALAPGKYIGGWAAFMSTGRPRRLWIKEIKWQGTD